MSQETLSDALPHSEDAERSLLGAVLLDNTGLDRALELLSASSF